MARAASIYTRHAGQKPTIDPLQQSALRLSCVTANPVLSIRGSVIGKRWPSRGCAAISQEEKMTRNLKALGLALCALVAIAAMASSASANYVFTSTQANTDLTGAQVGKHKFTTGGQSFECETATFSGTQSGSEAGEVRAFPNYSGCTFSTKTVHVRINGCSYLATGATQGSHGILHIQCPPGKVIEIEITNFPNAGQTCTLTLPEQTPGQGYSVVNNEKDMTVTTTVTGVKLTPHGAGNCLLLTTAVYNGTTTLQGYKHSSAHTAGNEVKVSVDS